MTAQELRDISMRISQAVVDNQTRRRWIDHILNRLAYERDLLGPVESYEGELTAGVLQGFAREHGAHKPQGKASEKGFELTSSVSLLLHLGNSTMLDLSADEWRDLMQAVGYTVPAKKPGLPPIPNFRAGELFALYRFYLGETLRFHQVEMTKVEYSAVHSEYRGTRNSICGNFRFKICLDPKAGGPSYSRP